MGGTEPGGGASRCAACGAAFHCGLNDPGGCWCARLPAIAVGALEPAAGCLCEACLRARIEVRQGAATR